MSKIQVLVGSTTPLIDFSTLTRPPMRQVPVAVAVYVLLSWYVGSSVIVPCDRVAHGCLATERPVTTLKF